MRRFLQFLWLLPLLFLSAAPAHATNEAVNGFCEVGNQRVNTSGQQSNTRVQASYPQCTVEVYVHGAGPAVIYSDASNTPLANPFTAAANGQWIFYAADGRYDVVMSGGTPNPFPMPVTISDILLNTSSGGGGGSAQPGLGGNLTRYQTIAPTSDNFMRLGPALGTNWTTITGLLAPTTTGNKVVGNSASYQGAYYTGATFPTNPQTASITVAGGSDNTNDDMAVVVYGTGNTYYEAISGNGNWGIGKVVGGSFTSLSGLFGSFAAVGDVITLTAKPAGACTELSFTYLSPATANFTYNVSVLDCASPLTSGSPGFIIHNTPAAISLFSAPTTTTTLVDSAIPFSAVSQNPIGPICYVDSGGDDLANNGKSLGTPMQTMYAALTTCLATGNPATYAAGYGTIYVTDETGAGVFASGPEGLNGPAVGVMLIGSTDIHWNDTLTSAARNGSNVVTLTFPANHNYSIGQRITVYGSTGGATSFNGYFTVASTPSATTLTYSQTGPAESATVTNAKVLPEGYLRETLDTNFVGIGGENNPFTGPGVWINGSNTDIAHPAFQLAGTARQHNLSGIVFHAELPVVIGVNSNLDRTWAGAGAVGPSFSNWGAWVSNLNIVNAGPALLWGGNIQFSNLFNTSLQPYGVSFGNISSIARSGNVVTVNDTGAALTGWQVGMQVQVSTVTDTSFNGLFTITAKTDDHHFSWNQTGANTTSSGGSVSVGPDNFSRCAILTGFLSSVDLNLKGRTQTIDGGICAENVAGFGENIHVDDYLVQSNGNPFIYDQPGYWCPLAACPYMDITLNEYSDPNVQNGFVNVAQGNDPLNTQVHCKSGASTLYITVDGPANTTSCFTNLNAEIAADSRITNTSPLAKGQSGQIDTRSLLQANDHRANLAPSLVKFPNLADQTCADWSAVDGNTTITCSQLDPSWNTSQAGKVSCTSGGCYATVYSSTRTVKPGDGIIVGVWIKSATTVGLGQGNATDFISVNTDQADGVVCSQGGPRYQPPGVGTVGTAYVVSGQEDGQWQWVYGWCRMTSATTGTARTVTVRLNVGVGYPAQYAWPMFLPVPIATTSRATSSVSGVVRTNGVSVMTTSASHTFLQNQFVCIQGVTDSTFNGCFQILPVPAPTSTTFAYTNPGSNGSSSTGLMYASADSEIAETALNLSAYPSSCAVGELCNAYGPLVNATGGLVAYIGGFRGTLTHANSADRTYTFPNANGTIPLPNLPQTWTAIQTYSQLNITESAGVGGVSTTTVFDALTSNHWPRFNPNNIGARAVCGSTGTMTSGHIVAINTTGTLCDLVDGGTGTGSGSVTTFSVAADPTPLFTTSVATPGTTPALTFTKSNFAANSFYGNPTGSVGAPLVTLLGASATTPPDYAADSGAADVLVAAFTPATTGLVDGLEVHVLPNHDNATTTPTLNADGSGAKTITKLGNVALAAGDLSATNHTIAVLIYKVSTNNWQLQNPQTTAASGMNTTMTNMGTTAMNADLLPAAASVRALGSLTLPMTDLFFSSAGASKTAHFDTSSLSANRVIKVPNAAVVIPQAIAAVSATFLASLDGTTGIFGTKVLTSTTGASGMTVTDTAGMVTMAPANTTGGGNAILQCTQTGGSQGDIFELDGTPKCVNVTPGVVPDARTTTTESIICTAGATNDRGRMVTFANAANIAVTVPSAATCGSNFYFNYKVIGPGKVTFTPTTSTVQVNDVAAAASFVALAGQEGNFVSDNTNYGATRVGYASGTTGTIGGAIVGVGCDTGTATILGATTSMVATTSAVADPGDAFIIKARVSMADTVTVSVCSLATLTPTSSVFNVRLQP